MPYIFDTRDPLKFVYVLLTMPSDLTYVSYNPQYNLPCNETNGVVCNDFNVSEWGPFVDAKTSRRSGWSPLYQYEEVPAIFITFYDPVFYRFESFF